MLLIENFASASLQPKGCLAPSLSNDLRITNLLRRKRAKFARENMKLYVAKSKSVEDNDKPFAVEVYSRKPMFYESSGYFYTPLTSDFVGIVDDSFGESLEIGQCAEIVGLTFGEIQTFGEVKG